MTHYSPDHIYQALQEVAQNAAPRDKLKALELMGKAKGMFIDRTQSDIHVTFTNNVPRPANEGEVIDIAGDDKRRDYETEDSMRKVADEIVEAEVVETPDA